MVLKSNNDGTVSIQIGPWMSTLVVALTMFMLAQSIIALRWGSQLDSRVASIEASITESRGIHLTNNASERDLQVRLARVEERLSLVYDTLRRFEERAVPRRPSPMLDSSP
jgi:hypothetical protein